MVPVSPRKIRYGFDDRYFNRADCPGFPQSLMIPKLLLLETGLSLS